MWNDDLIQFARLIDELSAAGVFHDNEVMGTLCESMDLLPDKINELVNRATNRFEDAKQSLTSSPDDRWTFSDLEWQGEDGDLVVKLSGDGLILDFEQGGEIIATAGLDLDCLTGLLQPN